MKKLIAVLLSATLVLSNFVFVSATAPAGYSEYLDFEDATVGAPVTGWNNTAMIGQAPGTSDPATLGTKIAKFSAPGGWQSTTYNGVYSVETGKKYELTAWINHLSQTVNDADANKSYVGVGLGLFDGTSFTGANFVASSVSQTIFNADGSIKIPEATSTAAYINMSTNSATSNYVNKGVWYKVILRFTASKTTTNGHLILRFNSGLSNEVLADNITFREMVYSTVTINSKESAAVVPVGTVGDPAVGDLYKFKVSSMDTSPNVTVNGTIVTPDANGIYSVTATAATNIAIVCDGDENLPASGKDASGRDLTTYNDDVYLTRLWEGDTVYHEAALFYAGRQTVKLLYPVDSVISLRSYDLKKYYVQGVDYEVTTDGQIKILPGSNIPVYSGGITTTTNNGWPSDTAGTYVNIYGDTTFPSTGICVTYKHTKTWSGGYTGTAPTSQYRDIHKTLAKLEAGEDVNIVIYGDSISCGWSSSGLNNPNTEFKVYNEDCTTLATTSTNSPYVINVAPYAPTWIEMFVWALREKYPDSKINVTNLSLGGKNAYWGRAQIVTRLQQLCTAAPDLVLMGWGVNDSNNNNTTADAFKTYCQGTVDLIRSPSTEHGNPNAEILFYSPMLPNINLANYDKATLLSYESALGEIAASDPSIGLVKLTSIFNDICGSKDQVDYLNTNLNHPNDFATRIYANSILAALEHVPPVAGDISGDGAVDLMDVTVLSRYVAGWQNLSYEESVLDTSGDGVVDLMDVTLLSRFNAGWNVTIVGPNTVQKATFSVNNITILAGASFMLPLSLLGVSKLGGDIAGYQLTVTYDSTKMDFAGYTPDAAWSYDSNVTTPGTANIVADNNNNSALTITGNGQIGTLKFNTKINEAGTATITVAVNELSNSSATPYTADKVDGSSSTVTIVGGRIPLLN